MIAISLVLMSVEVGMKNTLMGVGVLAVSQILGLIFGKLSIKYEANAAAKVFFFWLVIYALRTLGCSDEA